MHHHGRRLDRAHQLVNFLIYNTKGTIFHRSVDTSRHVKDADYLFRLFDEVVDEVGEENVVQFVTDNEPSYKVAGKKLIEKRVHLFWSPCAAHCIDLILERIGKKKNVEKIVAKARMITTFIYNYSQLVALMRKYTNNHELLRPGITRFPTNFIALESLYRHRGALGEMFASREWRDSRIASNSRHTGAVVEVSKLVLDKTFWIKVKGVMSIMEPLIEVLKLLDGDDKPTMSFLYEAMMRARTEIQTTSAHFQHYLDIIVECWSSQLHHDLHAAGYFLNPRFHYQESFEFSDQIRLGMTKVIERLTPNVPFAIEATKEVFELINKTIRLTGCSKRLACIVRNILLCDSSLHGILLRILCVTTCTLERLYINRHYKPNEIEGLLLVLHSALDIVFTVLADFSEDISSSVLPLFHQAMLCTTTNPVPVVTAMISLTCFFRSSAIQMAAARVLSMLCIVAEKSNQHSVGNLCFTADDTQIRDLSYAIADILSEETPKSEDLFIAVINLLVAAARYQPAFLVSILSIIENVELSLNKSGDTKHDLLQAASFRSRVSRKASIIDSLLDYVQRSERLIESNPRLLLSVLNFLKAMWQGITQYRQILKIIKSSKTFWKHLSCLASIATKKTSLENKNDNAISLAYSFQCQAAVLEIMALDIFLQQKLLHDEMLEKSSSSSSNGKKKNMSNNQITNSAHADTPQNILSSWCRSDVMDKLLKLYASCEYDKVAVFRAKMAASFCVVHIIEKVSVGDVGSLSLSFIEKINMSFKKLRQQAAYTELSVQYSLQGYRDGKEMNALMLGDLKSHLQGELEDLQMTPGPFKELSHYILELQLLQTNKAKCSLDVHSPPIDAYLFDTAHLQEDMGLEFWDYSNWKSVKEVAESMLLRMRCANVMAFLSDSQLAVLKAFTAIFSVHETSLVETKPTSEGGSISEAHLKSSIDYLCKRLHETVEVLVSATDNTELMLNFLETQVGLLFNLVRCFYRRILQKKNMHLALPVSLLVIKTIGTSLRVLIDTRLFGISHIKTVKVLLAVLLTSIRFSYPESKFSERSDSDSVDDVSEVSVMSLGLLPILCNCVEIVDYSNLSLAAIDIILKGFLASNTWLPVLQKHLRLQLLIRQLQQRDSLVSIPMILTFLLTLARTRGGAEMLWKAHFFSYLKVLFSMTSDEKPNLNGQDESSIVPTISSRDEKSQQHMWGLGLAIVTAIIYSLGEDSSSVDFSDDVISYFLSEKASLMDYYLSAPDLPIGDHSKKRSRIQRTQTSLVALRETENTLMLLCGLAKHQPSWTKAMRGTDSQLRERSIHLLAFISRGVPRFGESKDKQPVLLCHPILKEEVDFNGRPPFVNCKHGWFNPFAVGYMNRSMLFAISSTGQSPVIKDKVNGNGDSTSRTYFSDLVAIQMYRIAFLLLKFLCMQAKAAAKRAEDVGLVDLVHFPELPIPEILHGLQDQTIAIVTELCAGKSINIDPEIQSLCFLLLQVTEMALYLELCVSQIYSIGPVSGRIEDFSREIKVLVQLAEEHTFLKTSIKSLKQIITLVYPGLLQTGGIL